jgi:hypothetical protein
MKGILWGDKEIKRERDEDEENCNQNDKEKSFANIIVC